jgi:hypothetical protein
MGSTPRFHSERPALAGLAAPYGVNSIPRPDTGEVLHFLPGAFRQSLDDVREGRRAILALWRHEPDVLGGTHGGELRLWDSPEGLQFAYTGWRPAHAGRLQVSVGVGRGSDTYIERSGSVTRRVYRSAFLIEVSLTPEPLFPQTYADEYDGTIFPGWAVRHPTHVAPRWPPIDNEAGELVATPRAAVKLQRIRLADRCRPSVFMRAAPVR